MKDITSQFAAIDSALRNSEGKKAKELLLAMKRAKIRGADLIRFARLSCRVGLPGLGIFKLRPLVRPLNRKTEIATTDHLLEYAFCLVRLGACREAQGILKSIPLKNHPQANEIWAHLYLWHWNYHLAIPHFKAYIATLPPDDYPSTISRLNLSMALIFEDQFNEAALILNEIIANQTNTRFPILKGNCYRLLGILEQKRGNYSVAMQCLQKAQAIFGATGGLDAYLVKKSTAITQYFMLNASDYAKEALQSVLQEAITHQRWESVRDIEYHRAIFHQDEELMTKIYLGTPSAHFKEKIRRKFPNLNIPNTYYWRIGNPAASGKSVFDLENSAFKPGQVFYRLINILTSDFYCALSTADLFEGGFPGEFYQQGHSGQKVRQAISRIRAIFKEENLPLSILCEESVFRLASNESIDIVVRETSALVKSQVEHRVEKLKNLFQKNFFTLAEAAKALEIPRTTAQRLMTEAIEKGLLENVGKQKKQLLFKVIETTTHLKSFAA